ncbi:MAG: sigma 54-interacting transcriptional regulator [Betaproteobacteria bacterium]|nr:sigma 54-interacting transcriptional regulator [Betaproteobacteria bacterium]MBI3053171.1 sigma 54-interacting transcriptional regulator [Betaproteobacteria bacterium]
MSEQPRKILAVDDDPDLLRLLSIRLKSAGYDVIAVESAEKALAQLSVARPHLVVTDLRMSGMDGMALFDAIHQTQPTLPVIILTAHGTIPDAVAATKRGVFGYLTKPFDAQALLEEVGRALAVGGAAGAEPPAGGDEWRAAIITRNPALEDVLAKARLVAATDASVFIVGESGTGKELLAQAIHNASARRERAFVAINCGAMPEQLLESELFGHVKGAFTGAVRDHKGLFQSADQGTLFLDEIGDMPLPLQVKLLRVLQEKQVRPVGATQSIGVDVRVISATNRDIETEMTAGRFREDLYYRLNVVALKLPPLAERREDIPLLANHFLTALARKYHKTINSISPEALELLVSATWPGNVRQLYNVIEQSAALCSTPLIPVALVQQAIQHQQSEFASFEQARKQFERDYLTRLLKITAGNVSQAAKLAQRNRTEFYKLLQRHELDPAIFKAPKP